MSEQTLQAAKQLAACGFKVLPIRSGSKAPACKRGVDDATVDAGQLEQWFAHSSNGVGVSGEGFVIFDFDRHGGADGLETLAEWEAEHGKLPETLAQTTPSGGYHLIYRATDEVRPSVNPDLAVDVRAWGSYVVCDPTPGYCFEVEAEPQSIVDADEQVMAFLDYVRPGTQERQKVSVPKNGLKEGSRNDTLYRMACSLQSQEWDDDAIRAAIETYNAMSCKPPLSQGEIDKLLASVGKLPKGNSEEAKAKIEMAGLFTRNGKPRPNMFARKLIEEHHACLIDGAPAIWETDHYTMGWVAIDRAAIRLCDAITRQQQAEIRHYISRMAEERRAAPAKYIAFKNGVYDMDTGSLQEPTPELAITNVIPHDFNPGASCPEVDAVLYKMACGDADVLLNLQEIMGVCMYRSAEFGQSAILLGSGSNGKSTYIKMIRSLLGTENISSLDLGVIGKHFQTGRLLGKLANLGDDISNEFQHGDVLAVFKKVATGDRVYTDVKGAEGFEFTPYCTMVFSSNEFPRLADYSDGMMRRVFPIEFNATFHKSDADYNPRIEHKVTTEEACEYMCLLGLLGLESVRMQNGFTENAASRRRLEEIRQDNDTVLAWASDTAMVQADFIGNGIGMLYEQYSDWCNASGLKAVSRTKYSRQMRLHFGVTTSVAKRNHKTVRIFTIED